ncbi:MAG: type II toxin-antitoxin system VapC family toxin [Rhodospirillales bacterium]|nr:type II toxin-antitoxin system VapC family toxin [Rhodospirillales bacterium]
MTLVIDASVACKWFFEEPLSTEARALAETGEVFSAPDMILVECANAAWRRVSGETIPLAQAHAFLSALPQWFASLVPAARLHARAFEMACALNHPVYDCQYLALAEVEESRLVTADRAFVNKVRRSPWSSRIQSLGQD